MAYNKSTFRSGIVRNNGDIVFHVGRSRAADIAVDADLWIRPVGAPVPHMVHKCDRHEHLQALVDAKHAQG